MLAIPEDTGRSKEDGALPDNLFVFRVDGDGRDDLLATARNIVTIDTTVTLLLFSAEV